MAKGAVLSLKITGDASGASRALGEAEGKASRFGGMIGKVGGLMAGAFAVGAVIDFGKAAFDAASNLEQMAGSVDAVFGKFADQVHAQAQDAATAVGLSESAYSQMASVLGSQLKNAGISGQQLSDKVYDLIGAGSDMAAVFGGTTSDAVEALTATMRGEFDPIEKYGVSLNQTTVNAALAAKGQSHLTGAALRNAKVTATLGLIMKQTAQTHGQFAKQSNTAAERSQVLSAQFENIKASIGKGMLPIFSALTGFVSKRVIPGLQHLFRAGGPVTKIFGQIGAFVRRQLVPALSSLFQWLRARVLPIMQSQARVLSTVLVPAFRHLWDFVKTYVVPILKAILGPALSGLARLWASLSGAIERNRGHFSGLYEKIKPFLAFLKNQVAPFIGTVLSAAFWTLDRAIGPVIDSISWILGKAASVIGFLGKVGSFVFNPGGRFGGGGGGGVHPQLAYGATRGGMFGATRSLGGGAVGPGSAAGGLTVGGGTVVNITVNGALDPNAVARQINDLLGRYAARTGARVAVTR